MALRNTHDRYGAVAQALHWVVALGFVVQFALAWYMEDLPNTPFKIEMYNLHKSLGVTLLVLAALRLAWRRANPVPPLPPGRPRWEEWASQASHIGLYGLLFLQPLTGLAMALYSPYPSYIWGIKLPRPGAVEAVETAAHTAHFYLKWVILALVAVHVAAALRHHFILRDSVLRRMLPGFPRVRSDQAESPDP